MTRGALPSPAVPPVVPAFASAIGLVLALKVGTGGLATAEYYKERGTKGYAFVCFNSGPSTNVTQPCRTPADDIARIRAILKPAIGDLAQALGVSRQAIYDWQNGKPITAENAARLTDLASAADVFSNEGITGSAQALRRPIVDGKTLFDIARDGGSTEMAARTLVDRIRRELSQRERLAARLAGRRPAAGSVDDDGTPMLDERA
jgi:DNA-binding XRE family transcriptional regulator